MQGFKITFTNGDTEYVAAAGRKDEGSFIVFHGEDGVEGKRIQARLVRSIEPVEDVGEASRNNMPGLA